MTDPIAVLVRAAQEATAEADLHPDPVAAVRARVDRHRSGRRRARVLAAAAVVAVAASAGAALVVATSGDEEGGRVEITTEPEAPTTTTALVPTPPLAFRADVALAWTGEEVVVWGGDVEAFNMGVSGEDRSFSDGAAYDPATGTWRTMAAGPLPDGDQVRSAVALDAGVVVASGTATALWDPSDDTWRPLGDLPAAATLLGGGDRAFAWSAEGLAVLDLGDGTWTGAGDLPVDIRLVDATPTAVWTGEDVVVVGQPATPLYGGPMAAAAYHAEDGSWRALDAAPEEIGSRAPTSLWDGERVVVVDDGMGAATLDPATGVWDRLPDVPARAYEWLPITVTSGSTTATTMAVATAVLGPDDRWTPLPAADDLASLQIALDPPGAATSRVALWAVDADAETSTLVIEDLTGLVDATPRRQVGIASIELGPDDELVQAAFEPTPPDGQPTQAVVLDLDVAEGGRCTVRSTYLGTPELDAENGVPESLPADDPATDEGATSTRDWLRDPGGLVWEAEAGDSDLVHISCADPDAARRLAGTVVVSG